MQIYEQMSCPSVQDPSSVIEASPSNVVNADFEISGVIAKAKGHETTVVPGCKYFSVWIVKPYGPDKTRESRRCHV
jgi:hypothetical protein